MKPAHRLLACALAELGPVRNVEFEYDSRPDVRELIARTREPMGPRSMLVLLAAPQAVGYYAHLGFEPHPNAWVLRAGEPLGDANC